MTRPQQRAKAADVRLPLLALLWRFAIGAFLLGGAAALAAHPQLRSTQPVAYTGAGGGSGKSLSQLVPPGNTPTASALGRDMTVSWAQSLLTGGSPADGYV